MKANYVQMQFLLLMTVFMVGAGCRKTAPTTTAAAPAPTPTGFFDWCEKNNFGVNSPRSKRIKVGTTAIPGTPVGDMEFEA
jgi:hypothetical protein